MVVQNGSIEFAKFVVAMPDSWVYMAISGNCRANHPIVSDLAEFVTTTLEISQKTPSNPS
jgi:hypothetical protein